MSTGVIVQARMTSTRLPGKILAKIGGQTVLNHTLQRALKIGGVGTVVLAVPDDESADKVLNSGLPEDIKIFLGDEKNVLSRFYGVQNLFKFDNVIRLTADCPFVDPLVCGKMLDMFLSERWDYISNGDPRTFPHGFDCEIFKASLINKAILEAKTSYDLEHVTPYIKRMGIKKRNFTTADFGVNADYSHRSFVVDTREDLETLKLDFDPFQGKYNSKTFSFLDICEKHLCGPK